MSNYALFPVPRPDFQTLFKKMYKPQKAMCSNGPLTPSEAWYHDGIKTKSQCVCEGYLADFTEASLNFQDSKTCVGVVYAL